MITKALGVLHTKSRIWFSVLWIISYCILMSVGDELSSAVGCEKAVTLPIGVLLCTVLFLFLKKNGLCSEYGLKKPSVPAKEVLFYIPAIIILSANLWYGVTVNYGSAECILFILSMLCVGALEEVIFRGLLYGAMREESPTAAVIVSSLTFGIGHILNLFNGSGADILPNILQIVYATAAGFMFCMIYVKTDSLIVCILIHGIFNALSAFSRAPGGAEWQILSCILLAVISGGYALYLALKKSKR